MDKRGFARSKGTVVTNLRFSLGEEAGIFREVIILHWPQILSIGFFFGWLLSFPLQGPLFGALTPDNHSSPVLWTALFLFGHILGLAAGGAAGYFSRRTLIWFSWLAAPCTLISWLINANTAGIWWLFLALLGFFSGAAVISWVNLFASSVSPGYRGRTFILAAVLANLVLYLVTVLMGTGVESLHLLRAVSLLPLGMSACLFYRYRKVCRVSGPSPFEGGSTTSPEPFEVWQLFPFIFAVYAVGGLMYAVVGHLSFLPSGPLNYFRLWPYLLLLFPAGILADRAGRRINAVTGAVMVGIGFMAVGLLTGPFQFIAVQILLVGGYAFLDTFTWVVIADASRGRRATLFYSAVLGINILAILAGVLLGDKIQAIAEGAEILTVSLAGIFSFISLVFMIKLKDTFKSAVPSEVSSGPDSLERVNRKLGLTPREYDIVKLLLAGDSTPEILKKLVIAPDTLKSHLRNIYRKAGVRNRLEFTMLFVKEMKHPAHSGLNGYSASQNRPGGVYPDRSL